MYKFIAIILLICLSFQLSAKAAWYAYFQLNKLAIIEQFCENKLNKNANCEARCYLKKQAEKETASSAKIPGFIKEKEEQVTLSSICSSIKNQQSASAVTLFNYNNKYQFNFTKMVFHPPGI